MRLALALVAVVVLSGCAGSQQRGERVVSAAAVGGNAKSTTITTRPAGAGATARQALRAWRSTLFARTMTAYKEIEHAEGALVEPQGGRRFDLFDPFVSCPDGAPPVRFGAASDGGKFICADVLAAPDCVVYSLGSNNDFAFEEDVLKRTECTVVTFDCTSAARTVDRRHRFVKKCLGSTDRMAANPAAWITLEAAMASMGHDKLALLKIDVEGAEYDVLSAWAQDAPGLPRQLAMEVHYDGIYWNTPAYRNSKDTSNLVWPMHKMRMTDLALFMSHLAGAGYGIVSREDNPSVAHCSELTLLRLHR
jgi:FkbM family methyltransferase